MNGLSTVVFADISGSASLYETLGNARATVAVTQVTQWISSAIEAHGGRVVKKLGDGALGVFADASAATRAVAEMMRDHQSRLDRLPLPSRMHIRVGVATGEVVNVDGDCYGDAVNVASRLCERAGASEIWANEAAVNLAGSVPSIWYRRLGMMEVRGKAEALVLYQVEWRQNEEHEFLTMQAGLASQFAPAESVVGRIQFALHGSQVAFTSADAPMQLGRSTDLQLCVTDPRVSRLHARIDWRNGGFVLTDLSSFGTWVRFAGSESPVRLRRDTCLLHGAGRIALGVSFSEPSAPTLGFQVGGTKLRL